MTANQYMKLMLGLFQIITIGCTALGGLWPPQANVASALYPGNPPAKCHNPVDLLLPEPRQYILISVGHVLVDFQVLSIIFFFR